MKTQKELPPDIKKLVNAGNVTYRGMGFGEDDVLIKVSGIEYQITNKKFRELGWIKKISFSAPFRTE